MLGMYANLPRVQPPSMTGCPAKGVVLLLPVKSALANSTQKVSGAAAAKLAKIASNRAPSGRAAARARSWEREIWGEKKKD